MLSNLTIKNYRCFEDFHIDSLEQVNLFVGNNNSGKTSLLEAIYLLINLHDKEQTLIEIIYNRNRDFISNKHFYYQITNLFNRYQPNKSRIKANLDCRKIILDFSIKAGVQINLSFETREQGDNADFRFKEQIPLMNNYCLEVQFTDINNDLWIRKEISPYILVYKNNLSFTQMLYMWDKIDLTNKERKIIKALNIIENKLERISFSTLEGYNQVKLKIINEEAPISISNMGEGMYCLLTLALSLVTAENGVLLVDEIETGLHYKAQTDMWRLILETAKELNVQVFATTHSWDCITTFQEALSQVEDRSIGKLFRLDSKYDKLRAVEYSAEDLEIAVEEGIEVR
ncbi:conserved hypothetical protein [Hyella patelloides LEGE 07179]|uniref:Endonuclease GajA/Old nuclease/RecF-like AAA domain-containing protein n=1 Tax=Hyella patelloides LEGE 07179 TaxID=945734 RepID=A0A563VIM9_9CYAN|nr:ATP-binding protein [Hyella patelloides]VEP11306.1 conserved hypothetical protein [Hyella patelloides LEGE 07179]